MFTPKLVAFSLSLCCIHSALLGIVRLDNSFSVTDQDYIDYGATFTSVGRVTGGSGGAGTGTLIASNWVLTAGHLGTNTTTFTIGGQGYSVAETFRNPNYVAQGGSNPPDNDVMLMRLTANVPGITPSSYVSQGDTSYLGNEISFVGFGQGGTGLTGASGGQGTKRAGTNVADATYNDVSAFVFDFDDNTVINNTLLTAGGVPTSSQVPTSLEGQVAAGDSGGPAFYNDTIVGVGSFQSTISSRTVGAYGNWSNYTRIDLFSDWITETIPEPQTYAAALALLASLLAFTRRRPRLS